ncbi:hypothetical protein AAEU28_12910 [Pseudoalteromonas sp. SS15]|uniref:hypothetical protein n=1 Tax=Pseudoalteromonas sp. SS15 TaxID=3139393 RepID=UPI003BAA402C
MSKTVSLYVIQGISDLSSTDNNKYKFKQLSEMYLFEEIFKIIRISTGISVAFCYLVLLLTSMAYLHLFYSEFGISIVKYVSFEDMLATPIKNPNIVFTYIAVILVLVIADIGNRFRARKKLEYADGQMPKRMRVLSALLWAPNNPKTNLRFTLAAVSICVIAYIFAFAKIEANDIKAGESERVLIVLSDQEAPIETSLLGTSVNYVFTYDHKAKEATIFYVEAIKSIKSFKEVAEEVNTIEDKKSASSQSGPESEKKLSS